MTNRERAKKWASELRTTLDSATYSGSEEQCRVQEWRLTTNAIEHAIDEATAAAESRAREAEADAAVMRELIQRIDDTDTHGRNVIVDGRERPTGVDFCGRCNRNSFHSHTDDCPMTRARRALAPHPGAALLAELEAAREIVEMVRDKSCCEGIDVTPTDETVALLAKYDAARGAR